MRPILCSALLFACAVAGPMDRGSISPGGQLGFAGYMDMGDYTMTGSVSIAPGLEYAIAPGLFVGGDLSLGWEPGYQYWSLGPVARACLASAPPWPFFRVKLTYAEVGERASAASSEMVPEFSIGLLTMLGHGVALEPALTIRRAEVLSDRWYSIRSNMSAGIGIGLRSYIYK